MRRKKDDKRVLVSPRETRKNANKRQKILRNRNKRIKNANNYNNNANNSRASKITLFLLIFALLAFVVGAGLGIFWNVEDSNTDAPQWINVTEEMTTNLNDTEPVYYDASVDNVDYNNNQELEELNATTEPSY